MAVFESCMRSEPIDPPPHVCCACVANARQRWVLVLIPTSEPDRPCSPIDTITGLISGVVGSPSTEILPEKKFAHGPRPTNLQPTPQSIDENTSRRRGTTDITYLVEERTVVHGILLALDLQVVPLGLWEEKAPPKRYCCIPSNTHRSCFSTAGAAAVAVEGEPVW